MANILSINQSGTSRLFITLFFKLDELTTIVDENSINQGHIDYSLFFFKLDELTSIVKSELSDWRIYFR